MTQVDLTEAEIEICEELVVDCSTRTNALLVGGGRKIRAQICKALVELCNLSSEGNYHSSSPAVYVEFKQTEQPLTIIRLLRMILYSIDLQVVKQRKSRSFLEDLLHRKIKGREIAILIFGECQVLPKILLLTIVRMSEVDKVEVVLSGDDRLAKKMSKDERLYYSFFSCYDIDNFTSTKEHDQP